MVYGVTKPDSLLNVFNVYPWNTRHLKFHFHANLLRQAYYTVYLCANSGLIHWQQGKSWLHISASKAHLCPLSTNLRIILLLLFQTHSEWGTFTHSEGIRFISLKSRGLNVNTLCVWEDFEANRSFIGRSCFSSFTPETPSAFGHRTHRITMVESSACLKWTCSYSFLETELVETWLGGHIWRWKTWQRFWEWVNGAWFLSGFKHLKPCLFSVLLPDSSMKWTWFSELRRNIKLGVAILQSPALERAAGSPLKTYWLFMSHSGTCSSAQSPTAADLWVMDYFNKCCKAHMESVTVQTYTHCSARW